MKEEYRTRIQEIIDGMQCPKDFKCAQDGFENLCKTMSFGSEHFLQCLEETSPPCPFAGVYENGFQMHFCRCPLRAYLAKSLKK